MWGRRRRSSETLFQLGSDFATIRLKGRSRLDRKNNLHAMIFMSIESELGGLPESAYDGAVKVHAADWNPCGLPYDQEFVLTCDGCAHREDLLNVPQRSIAGS